MITPYEIFGARLKSSTGPSKGDSHDEYPLLPLLRQALVADATTSAAFGPRDADRCRALERRLRPAGDAAAGRSLVLLPYAAFIGWLGLRETIGKPVAWAVVLGNALWVLDSILLLASGWVSPTSAGYAFVIAQGFVVLMYAEFQVVGLRRSREAVA